MVEMFYKTSEDEARQIKLNEINEELEGIEQEIPKLTLRKSELVSKRDKINSELSNNSNNENLLNELDEINFELSDIAVQRCEYSRRKELLESKKERLLELLNKSDCQSGPEM